MHRSETRSYSVTLVCPCGTEFTIFGESLDRARSEAHALYARHRLEIHCEP